MWNHNAVQFQLIDCPKRVKQRQSLPTPSPESTSESMRLNHLEKQSLPPAIVVWWDEKDARVLCPFCLKIHRRGVNHFACDERGQQFQDTHGRFSYREPSSEHPESRVGHCDYRPYDHLEYVILFPFEEDNRVRGLSFEVESVSETIHGKLVENERFRTVGLEEHQSKSVPQENEESDEEVSHRLKKHSIESLALQLDIIHRFPDGFVFTQRATEVFGSCCQLGDLNDVKSILEACNDRERMIQFKDEHGMSALQYAVCGGQLEVVQFLLDNGADENCVDAKGRTPLMEAALWGHIKIADVLIKRGGDLLMKDRNGMIAADFVEESERNDKERHHRALKYQEDPYIKKKDRWIIKCLLGCHPGWNAEKSRPLGDVTDASFYKSTAADSVSIVVPRTGIKIATRWKTAAILNRGGPFPVVLTTRGSNGNDQTPYGAPQAGFTTLNRAYWTKDGLQLADSLGFNFRPNKSYDWGTPGSYYACHAEAQLMSFFVRKNYVFRDYTEQERVNDGFLQLFLLQPRNKQAQILVAHEAGVCSVCQRYADHIKACTEIEFDFKVLKHLNG